MPTPLRVATYNLHAGVDGWGRPTRVVDAAVALDADVLCLQEAWRGDGVDLAHEIAAGLGANARFVALAEGWRVTGGEGTPGWQHPLGLLVGNRGLFLDSVHPLPDAGARRLAASEGAERGEWGTAIVSRLPFLAHETVALEPLPRDLARRVVARATLQAETGSLEVACVHAAHLSHGSLRQFGELAAWLGPRVDGRNAVLGGDLNCWGPLARRVLKGWRQAVRGATWPSWRPHSQLDHVFVRGSITVVGGGPIDARQSDHRPVLAELRLDGGAGGPPR